MLYDLPRLVSNSVYPLSRLNPLAKPFSPRNPLNSTAPAHPPPSINPATPLPLSVYPFSQLNPYPPYAHPFFPRTHPFYIYISLAPAPLPPTPMEPHPFIAPAKLSSASAERLFPKNPLSSATAPTPLSLLSISTQSEPPTLVTPANLSSLPAYRLSRPLNPRAKPFFPRRPLSSVFPAPPPPL